MNYVKDKVSVIMGVYNCEKTLEESINSIVKQTYENWELIICDDCSEDNTYKIAKRYKTMYPKKIKLIKNEKNIKLSATLNHCLKYADGEYIARMDGDDISLENRFEVQVEFLKLNVEYDLIGTSMISFDKMGDRGIRQVINIPKKEIIFRGTPFCHATIMARKYVYDQLGGYTVSKRTERGQDVDLWIRFFEKNFKGYNIQKPYYKVRENKIDFKRRTIKAAIGVSKTLFLGVKKLNVSKKNYIWSLKPIVSSLVPKRIISLYHKNKDKERLYEFKETIEK